MKNKLKMPLLAMGGECQSAAFLADHSRRVASMVKESKIKGAGHWLVQENTAQVQQELLDFFIDK
jgi:pimeloyl-ACP methyl ester carboxylesterase